MFNHVLINVDKSKLRMGSYREGSFKTHECGSAGCVIGHCIILDEWKNIPRPPHLHPDIDFDTWSYQWTGLSKHMLSWDWCFGSMWYNNKEQILLRLKYFIDNKSAPENWLESCNDSPKPYETEYLLPSQTLIPYEL